jgi:hypothetical protein
MIITTPHVAVATLCIALTNKRSLIAAGMRVISGRVSALLGRHQGEASR